MSAELRRKSSRVVVKATSAPTDAQLQAISRYTLRAFTADELSVRTFALCHNGIDRDNEVLDEALLHDFERTLPGKGCFFSGHPNDWRNDGGPAEGLIFAARIERMTFEAARELLREPQLRFPPDRNEAAVLFVDTYFARTDENAGMLLKMEAGIGTSCSIGFTASDIEPIRDADGRELRAYRWVAPGEGLEMSLVWLGAQNGARAIKSATKENTVDPDLKKKLDEKTAECDREKARADAAQKSVDLVAALKSALGTENAALLDDPVGLVKLALAGKTYRTSLVDDIVIAERHLGITGDSDDAVAAAKGLYAGMPVDKLQAMCKGLQARVPAGGAIKGGDPNKTPPGAHQVPEDSQAKNPLFGG